MPVELPVVDLDELDPSPPRSLTWCALFVLVVIVGCAVSIFEWPKTEPTGTAWFWCRSFVLPALFWCALFGLRLHYYNDECAKIAAELEEKVTRRKTAIEFASEPLAVLDFSYVTALGISGLSAKIAEGESALRAQTTRDGDTGVRHTALAFDDGTSTLDLHRKCFTALLTQLSGAVGELPRDVPLYAYLDVPVTLLNEGQLLATWNACCEMARMRQMKTELLPAGEGIMAIDKWLDVSGGPRLERVVLFVSVELHEHTLNDSGEAAVALLLGWAPLVARRRINSVAMLHRPIEADSKALTESLSKAMLWGNSKGAEIEDAWTSGLVGEGSASFFRCSTELAIEFVNTPEFSGIHNVENALGNCRASAEWLNVALASEHAALTGKPQLTISSDRALRICVVRPPLHQGNGPIAGELEQSD
ncbi:hypothetical protein ACFSHT_17605 [Paraburkholderia silviterrae]|uniref:Uncharacterized protein n=1 Tax=Paraburkholderia silviterrae TaxID=2528715 RepID=A0A4R5M3P1_9BURK|nr:hypothetical protein [Paraburkholderia silviterrae]TDG20354.1 hypothetical protein EYW47_26250 [Paraburkholderia silviterrae]